MGAIASLRRMPPMRRKRSDRQNIISGNPLFVRLSERALLSYTGVLKTKAMPAPKTYTWKEAFSDASEAAKAGSPRHQTFVGYCYDLGRGVARDPKMARRWYERAVRNGNVDAMFNLAVMNDKGTGARRNAVRAASLYE